MLRASPTDPRATSGVVPVEVPTARRMHPWWAAVAFLTRIPVPGHGDRGNFGSAVALFPAVGLLLGLILLGAHTLAAAILPPLVVAALVVTLWAALTGALHLDGLADSADGTLAHATVEHRLEIMRDPRTGAFGVVALILVLGLKIAAVASLTSGAVAPAVLLATMLGRWGIAAAAGAFPYARPQGLGAGLHDAATPLAIALASLLPLLLALAFGLPALPLLLVGVAATFGTARWLSGKLNGLTGDCYGAICEIVETAVLVAATAIR